MPDNMVLSYIRQANADDAMKIANLFVAATERMIIEGIHQWNFTYPLLTHVQEDIKMDQPLSVWSMKNSRYHHLG